LTTVNGLDSFFTNIISNMMVGERQPLERLQQQRDSISVRSATYADVNSKLTGLQLVVDSLRSSSLSPALTASRSISISDRDTGYTVLSANASSSAVAGSYVINNITLAKAHRVRSDQQAYIDQALQLSTGSGYIVLGGADSRSTSLVQGITDTITSFNSASIDVGRTELGRGTYSIETRNDPTQGWQFRLVDSSGESVDIRNGSDINSTTSGWQDIPTGGGAFDTGRGLVINFASGSPNSYQSGRITDGTAAQVNYVAQGAHIKIESTDSLNNIASKINDAQFAESDSVAATIVDRQLVISSTSTGTAYALEATNVIDNGSGGTSGVLHSLGLLADGSTGFKYGAVQAAENASFWVNGIHVTRSSNSGLTDVISGVTLNLDVDAAGRSATLTVNKDLTSARAVIDDFASKFNSLQTYLEQKTAVTRNSNGTGVTYTRGTLADDSIFSELRANLFSIYMQDYSNSGAYNNLHQIGISIDDNLQITVNDTAKLESALSSNLDSVESLMDGVMGKIDQTLGRFTGVRSEGNYLDEAVSLLNNQLTDLDVDISDMNEYLVNREEYYVNQYSEMQAQLINLSYAQQMWQSIYNSSYNLYA
jgi:flagellar hook-associated protein 2